MKIKKSSRHSKITGDFGENLVLYWLSKHGFECALVDHTGIDIIANNPHTGEIMGISVKSRCRSEGKEDSYLNIPNDNFSKVSEACKAFGCVPYFAIIVDAGGKLTVFLLAMQRFLEISPPRKIGSGWYMKQKNIRQYLEDKEIMIFELEHSTHRWWKSK